MQERAEIITNNRFAMSRWRLLRLSFCRNLEHVFRTETQAQELANADCRVEKEKERHADELTVMRNCMEQEKGIFHNADVEACRAELSAERERHAAELDGIRAACDARVANVVARTNEMAQKREDRALAAADQRHPPTGQSPEPEMLQRATSRHIEPESRRSAR